MSKFDAKISDILGYYVYRLIDPRNGETFYVGKGKGNRVFQHAAGEYKASSDDTEPSDKRKRIIAIRNAGFEVAHVIHRHGLDKKTSFEVEGALIDAYATTSTNKQGGHHNNERGVMHANEIIQTFSAEEVVFHHKIIAIIIPLVEDSGNVYETVRYAWRLDKSRAEKAEYVLAVHHGLVKGVFKPDIWHKLGDDVPEIDIGRVYFDGKPAPEEIQKMYMGKRMPEKKRGAANPVHYFNL